MISIPLTYPSIALYDNYFAVTYVSMFFFLKKKNYVFLFFLLAYRAFPEYAACEVIAIPAKYDFKPYAYGFQKDSPYLPLFNHYLKDMREKGSLNQILKKYEAAPQVCPDSSGLPLGFDSCFTAFLLLIGTSIKIYVKSILPTLLSTWPIFAVSRCGSFKISLSLRFYVKSIVGNFEVLRKMSFLLFLGLKLKVQTAKSESSKLISRKI